MDEDALACLAIRDLSPCSFAEVRLFTVYRDGTDKFGLYAEPLGSLDELLRTEGEYGMVVLDGL